MSILRRRAIVVSRARSAERNSTGGRVSARAAAAESSGSASTRSQAIASRTSGRWKSAAGPARWNGTPRSSIAAATVPATCTAGRRAARRSTPEMFPAAEQMLGLARHRLRLRPLIRAAPVTHRRFAEHLVKDEDARLRVLSWVRGGAAGGRSRPRPPLTHATRRRGVFGVEVVRILGALAFARIARWAGVVSSSSSTMTWTKRVAISARTSGRSCRSLLRMRKTSAAIEVAATRRGCGRGRRRTRRGRARAARSRPSARRSEPAGERAGRPDCRGSSWLRSGRSSR